MSRYDGLIIPRSYSEYINKTDAATLQQALQLSGVLSGAVAAGDNKAVTSNAVNGALANYEVKQNIGFVISRTTYKISFPNRSYLKIITRGCEEVTVYRGTELKAFRNSNTYTKVDSINYADNYLYVTIKEYAEQTYILTDSIKTIETSTIPTTVTNIPITEIATKSALANYRKFKKRFINPSDNDWGLTENQILSTSDFITLLEEKGFLATESDTAYRNCTLAFRHYLGGQVYLQLSSIKVSLTSAVINCESSYNGYQNWLGFRKITIIGKAYFITYTMSGWNYFAKTS